VTVELWSLGMVVVVALNVAVVAAAATVTDAGTVRKALVSEIVTNAPPAGAAPVSVTVQLELLEGFNEVGLHEREETVGNTDAPPVTVPPVAVTRTAFAEGPVARPLVTPIAVRVAPAAMVRFTTATVPFAMVATFNPDARQV
jgi:hypothetical protein